MDEKGLRHGAIGWNELMTTDPQAAAEFYGKLLGWTTEDASMEDTTYLVFKVDDDAIGGIMGMPPESQGMPPAWGAYITVDNVDETAQKVTQLGGQVLMPPQDIPDIGRFCVIQDPQGAVISLITYVPRDQS